MSQSDPQGSDLVGTVLGDAYRLTRLIGRGGMGSVYEGVQLRLNKRVAVKLMARELAANAEALARFRREAEVTSQLGHPHIVQVFDFGAAPSGEPYLVMEFLEGEDLEQRMRRVGRMSPAAAALIVRQIASALSATHAKGIVHRDLKPANVFVLAVEGETDFVKVVDFGISKVRAAATRLTAAAAVMGTPNYMSPEQAAGQVDEIDHRTNQWAVACIAYELIAGRPPFVGENVASLLYQVVHQAPSPLGKNAPGVPPDVEQVLGCALSKKQTERFANMTAFARAFEAAATGASIAAPPSPAHAAPVASPMAAAFAPGAAAAAFAPAATPAFAPAVAVAPLLATELPAPASAPVAAFVPSPPDRAKATTFSTATGESTPPVEAPRARATPKWIAAGAAGAALLLVGVLLGTRHRGEAPASGVSSAPAAPAPPPAAAAAGAPTVGAPAPPPAPAAAAPAAAPPVEVAARAAPEPPAAVKPARSRRKSGPAWPPPPSSRAEAAAMAAPAPAATAPPPAPEPPPPPPPQAADAPAWPPPPGAAATPQPAGKPKRGFIRNLRRKIFE